MMIRVSKLLLCLLRLLIIQSLFESKSVQCDQKRIPVYYPNRISFPNESKPFTIRVTRFICTETPYKVSELLQCKTVLRRNSPTFLNLTIHVPKVLNTMFFQVKTYYRLNDYQIFPADVILEACAYLQKPSEDIFSRHVLSVFFETVPELLYYCPHGNRTYSVAYWLEERFFPKSIPAGDYRQDVWFRDEQNQTLLAYQAYFSVRRLGVWKSLLEW